MELEERVQELERIIGVIELQPQERAHYMDLFDEVRAAIPKLRNEHYGWSMPEVHGLCTTEEYMVGLRHAVAMTKGPGFTEMRITEVQDDCRTVKVYSAFKRMFHRVIGSVYRVNESSIPEVLASTEPPRKLPEPLETPYLA